MSEIIFSKIDIEDYILPPELDENIKSYIYGEVNEKDLLEIIKTFEYENLNFIDIGSGCGKIIIYLSYKLNIFSTGVEINIKRYNKSVSLLEKFNIFNNVELLNQDYKKIYFGNYDILYCCNKVFDKEDNDILYNKILNEFTGYCLLFDYNHILKKYLLYKKEIRTSWNKNEFIYIFQI